jgi:hypothetical protein
MSDAARLLHRRSELGYTNRAAQAMTAEPEAVSAREQAELTRQAHQRAGQRERDAWRRCRDVMLAELELARRELDRSLASDLRVIERQLERITRKVYASS